MTKVLIVNRLYRYRTRKVFVVNHRYRRVMPKIIVVALGCGLMLSAWGGARAAAVNAESLSRDQAKANLAVEVLAEEDGAPVDQGESNPAPSTSAEPTAAQPTTVPSGDLTPRAESGSTSGMPVTTPKSTSAPATSAPATSAPATSATSAQPAASGQAVATQPAVGSDEVLFREDEWVTYLALPADQEAELKRALAVKHRHMSELANIPGVWLVWVDADKDQPPIIRVDVNEETPGMDRLVPAEIEGVPVEVVKADQWFLMEPPYSTPTNFREGAPLAEPPLNGIQAGGQGGVSNSRIDPAASLSAWSKIGPVEAARNCERGRAFLIWLAADLRFIAHYTRVIQQRRGANWFYDQNEMVEMYRDGVCVAASDPRLAGR